MEFEIWQFILLFVVGLVAGFIDAVAGGGGLICIPALLAVGVPPHAALATNKLQGSFGTLSASINFIKKGYIKFSDIYLGIIFTLIGAILGTTIVLFIDAKFLNYIMPVLLLGIFLYTLFSPTMGEKDRDARMSKNAFYVVFGLFLGFYDGFFGPGTGSFWVFALVALLGLNMKQAVANTKVMNFTSNIVSLAVFIVGGHILWMVGFVMAAGQIIGGYLGANLVITKDIKYIKWIFLTVVGATILKLFIS